MLKFELYGVFLFEAQVSICRDPPTPTADCERSSPVRFHVGLLPRRRNHSCILDVLKLLIAARSSRARSAMSGCRSIQPRPSRSPPRAQILVLRISPHICPRDRIISKGTSENGYGNHASVDKYMVLAPTQRFSQGIDRIVRKHQGHPDRLRASQYSRKRKRFASA